MSKRKPRQPVEHSGEGLWVYSDLLPDGRYGPSVSYGADRVWPLDDPLAYAATVGRVAITAQHDAATARLLYERMEMPLEVVGELLRSMRGAVARPRVEVLPGLSMTPGINPKLKPFITIDVKGTWSSQVDADNLLQHAHAALSTAAAAELDTKLREVLLGPVGLDEERVSAVIAHLSAYWPGRSSVG